MFRALLIHCQGVHLYGLENNILSLRSTHTANVPEPTHFPTLNTLAVLSLTSLTITEPIPSCLHTRLKDNRLSVKTHPVVIFSLRSTMF
jgi:hypothetical protein